MREGKHDFNEVRLPCVSAGSQTGEMLSAGNYSLVVLPVFSDGLRKAWSWPARLRHPSRGGTRAQPAVHPAAFHVETPALVVRGEQDKFLREA